mgnify:CR=1 FL=1
MTKKIVGGITLFIILTMGTWIFLFMSYKNQCLEKIRNFESVITIYFKPTKNNSSIQTLVGKISELENINAVNFKSQEKELEELIAKDDPFIKALTPNIENISPSITITGNPSLKTQEILDVVKSQAEQLNLEIEKIYSQPEEFRERILNMISGTHFDFTLRNNSENFKTFKICYSTF